MRIAIDAMGGDRAPEAVLAGALDALDLLAPTDELILVGDEGIITQHIASRGTTDPRVSIERASQVIAMDEKPAQAVRTKRESSIVRLALLGSSKHPKPVDVILSAGNTGACVSAAIMHMRRLAGVHRPGIAVTIPAFSGPVTLCDAGANPDPTATHLWQYAIMAETYARNIHSIASPRVAILNIGSEESKGSDRVRAANDWLKITPGLNYVGFIEGRDLFEGVADVVITDGFVGNTMLKMAEGLSASLLRAIAHEIAEIDPGLIAKFEPIVKRIYKKNDYHEYGGAPLLGVNGGCFIAHGSSEPRTIRAAIRNSRDYVATGVNEAIRARLIETDAIAKSIQEPA